MPASMGDTLLPVTTHVSPSSSSRNTRVRRAGRVTALTAGVVLVLLSAPAHADVPEGWGGQTQPFELDPLHALGLLLLLQAGMQPIVPQGQSAYRSIPFDTTLAVVATPTLSIDLETAKSTNHAIFVTLNARAARFEMVDTAGVRFDTLRVRSRCAEPLACR